jgi:hypothetical protein
MKTVLPDLVEPADQGALLVPNDGCVSPPLRGQIGVGVRRALETA